MDALPPIPSPFRARWLRLRWKLVHLGVFLALGAGIVVAWQRLQLPNSFVGQVETIQTVVSSRDAGYVTNLWVLPLQEIQAGDLVAEIVTTDPRTVNNRLEAMRDRMRLAALEMEPILSRERSAVAYEELSVNCDRVRAELAIARVRLQQAESQLKRDQQLFKQGVLSAELFELSRRNKESYDVEVLEKANLVERTEKTLDRLKTMSETFVPGGENDPIRQALAVEEDKMKVFEAKATPLRLVAPTNGVVTLVHHHAGEQVLAGEPIATITSSSSGRIAGFLPPNFPIVPRVGMEIEVYNRALRRARGRATVIGVSPHVQSVTNALVPPVAVHPVIVPGMRRVISISLPAELPLLPGEPVDLAFVEKPIKSKQPGRSGK